MRESWWTAAVALMALSAAGCSEDHAPRVEVSWRLVGGDGVSGLSCEQAGTRELNVHVHKGERYDRSPHTFTQLEACSAGRAMSQTLEEGTFWVTITLAGGQGQVVDTQTSGPYELVDNFVVKVPEMILKPR